MKTRQTSFPTVLLTLLCVFFNPASAKAVEYLPLTDYVKYYMPQTQINVAMEQFSGGAARLMWAVETPGELAVDTKCTDTVKLLFGDEVIGEIKATAKDVEGYCVAFFGSSMMDDDLPPEIVSMSLGFQFGYDDICTPGYYTLSIPDGFFTIDGNPLPACTKNYSIAAQWYGDPEDMAEGLELSAANSFTVYYKSIRSIKEGHYKTKWGYDYSKARLRILFDGDDVTDRFQYKLVQNPVSAIFTAKPGQEINKEGTLHMTIDSGYFLTNSEDPVTAVDYHFSTLVNSDPSAVEAIDAGAEGFGISDIYDLQGRSVAPQGAAAQLLRDGQIAPGIYIERKINGESLKILVK